MFTIVTPREHYSVDAQGNIGRPSIGMAPSGKWKLVALVQRNNFGVLDIIPFAKLSDRVRAGNIKWSYKNGKPRYTVRDNDHGTTREWGEMVTRITLDQ